MPDDQDLPHASGAALAEFECRIIGGFGPSAGHAHDAGAALRAIERDSAVFYASGHAGLEVSHLYELQAMLRGSSFGVGRENRDHAGRLRHLQ